MKKGKSVGCGKVSITGKCEDGIGTCKFTLKRQCSPIKVTGVQPLKDAYQKLTGEDLPVEHVEKAAMGVRPACLVGLAKPRKPVCSADQRDKRETCIQDMKATNAAKGCRPEGTRSKKCPNAFAVCTEAVGCRPGRKAEMSTAGTGG